MVMMAVMVVFMASEVMPVVGYATENAEFCNEKELCCINFV